jgi:c-di-GMP-binding flagellar brake protein YcgR
VPETVDLAPGTNLKVSPPGDPLGIAYEATVRTVLPSGLRLGLPRRDDDVLDVEPGTRLTMFTMVRGSVYRFQAHVRLVEVDQGAFVIDHPREAERTERREFYRLVTRIAPRRCALLDDNGDETTHLHGVILDLSGGGILLQASDFVAPGSRLRLVFELDGDPLEMDVAAIVLSGNRPASNARNFRMHCQFLELSKNEMERLVRFIYRQQVALRQKGVI